MSLWQIIGSIAAVDAILIGGMYCGRKPPDVRLEVDHVHPRAEGGGNDPTNLVTACNECNRGKSSVPLAEVTVRPDAVELYLRAQHSDRENSPYDPIKPLAEVMPADSEQNRVEPRENMPQVMQERVGSLDEPVY